VTPTRICVFPNDPLSAYLAKGEVKARYFNPCDFFDEVHVMTSDEEDVDPRSVQEVAGRAGLFIHAVGRISPAALIRIDRYRRRVIDRVRAINPDVIRAYNPLFAGWLAVSCAQRLGKPSVISIHGNYDKDVRRLFWLEGRFLHFAKYSMFAFTTEPYVLQHADKVICAYQFPVDYARRYGARDIRVIYNRVDLGRFLPQVKSRDRAGIEVLTVGRLDPEKNHACLIRALPGADGVRLRIVGDGVQYSTLNSLARRLGVTDRVEFVRQVPHRDIHREYQRADVFAIATRYGGIHIPVLEAMAAGLPIIVPKPRWEDRPEVTADIAEVVANRPEAFRESFIRLRDDPEYRATLGARARARVGALSGSVMEERERQVYEELFADHRSC
jgi:glycosyltransferase involved in cell wall biosynthesis